MIGILGFLRLINSWLTGFSEKTLQGFGVCGLFFYLCSTLHGRGDELSFV